MSQIKYEPGSDFACGYMAALAQARVEAAARTRDNVLAEGIAKGYSEGLARGLAQGEVQGRRKMIVRLLTLRFGALSSGLEASILDAHIDELDAIGQRLLTAATLQDAIHTD